MTLKLSPGFYSTLWYLRSKFLFRYRKQLNFVNVFYLSNKFYFQVLGCFSIYITLYTLLEISAEIPKILYITETLYSYNNSTQFRNLYLKILLQFHNFKINLRKFEWCAKQVRIGFAGYRVCGSARKPVIKLKITTICNFQKFSFLNRHQQRIL